MPNRRNDVSRRRSRSTIGNASTKSWSKMNDIELSVVTATWRRPKLLAMCLQQFRAQSTGELRTEHVIVSDGPDPMARAQASAEHAQYVERTNNGGRWGAFAKDDGIAAARGRYVCFWDDDNLYEPHALTALLAAAWGVDIGIVQCRHLLRTPGESTVLPRSWAGEFRLGDIDSMCVCVRREVALTERWADSSRRRGEDYRWLARLKQRGVSIRFAPIVIGTHL